MVALMLAGKRSDEVRRLHRRKLKLKTWATETSLAVKRGVLCIPEYKSSRSIELLALFPFQFDP